MTTTPAPSIAASPLTGTSTGPFPTGFKYGAAADVRVWLELAGVRQPDLTQGADYTLTGATPRIDGGTVTLGAALVPLSGWDEAAGDRVVIARRTVKSQGLALPDSEGHKPAATEAALDKLMRASEETADELARALVVPAGETGYQLPPAEQRRGRVIGFADTDEVEVLAVANDAVAVAEDLMRAETARDGAEAARDVSIGKSGEAATSSEAAVAARNEAELFLAAFDPDNKYPDEPTGRAAVLDGETFTVATAGGDGVLLYRRIDAATPATLLMTLPSLSAIQAQVGAAVSRIVDCDVSASGSTWTLTPKAGQAFIGGAVGQRLEFDAPADSPMSLDFILTGVTDDPPDPRIGVLADQVTPAPQGLIRAGGRGAVAFRSAGAGAGLFEILSPTPGGAGAAASTVLCNVVVDGSVWTLTPKPGQTFAAGAVDQVVAFDAPADNPSDLRLVLAGLIPDNDGRGLRLPDQVTPAPAGTVKADGFTAVKYKSDGPAIGLFELITPTVASEAAGLTTDDRNAQWGAAQRAARAERRARAAGL